VDRLTKPQSAMDFEYDAFRLKRLIKPIVPALSKPPENINKTRMTAPALLC